MTGEKSDSPHPPKHNLQRAQKKKFKKKKETWNAPGWQRHGNDKQNVTFIYLFNTAFLKVRGVLKLRLSEAREDTRVVSTAALCF